MISLVLGWFGGALCGAGGPLGGLLGVEAALNTVPYNPLHNVIHNTKFYKN